MKFCPCTSSSDRGARYGAQTGASLGTKVGAKRGGPFAVGFNAGLGSALGYVAGSVLDDVEQRAKPTMVPDGGEVGAENDPDGPTEIPVTEEPLFE